MLLHHSERITHISLNLHEFQSWCRDDHDHISWFNLNISRGQSIALLQLEKIRELMNVYIGKAINASSPVIDRIFWI